MKVRVVEAFERRALAWVIALVGGCLTTAVLMNTIRLEDAFGWDRRWSFGASAMLWMFGLLVGFRQPAYLVKLEDIAKKGRTVAVCVARGVRGFSIAAKINDGGVSRGFFFEAESESDARKVVEALRGTWPRSAVVDVEMSFRRDDYNAVMKAIAALGFVSAMMYGIMVGTLQDPDYKGTFGIPAIIAGLVASFMFIIAPLFRQSVDVGTTALKLRSADLTEHLMVHATGAVTTPKAPIEDAQIIEPRMATLDRSPKESTAAWLQRLDAMNNADAGYRADATFTNEELLRMARDPAMPTNVRLGATRLLTRRIKDVHFRVGDIDLEMKRHVRVVVNVDDANEAAEDLDELGPAFRLRH